MYVYIHAHRSSKKNVEGIYVKAVGLKAHSPGQQAASASPEQCRVSGPHPDEEVREQSPPIVYVLTSS